MVSRCHNFFRFVILIFIIGFSFLSEFVLASDDRPQITLTKAAVSPSVDGAIRPWEYTFAGTGFLVPGSGLCEYQSKYFMSYDNENIYFAVETPIILVSGNGEEINVGQSVQSNKPFLVANVKTNDTASIYRDDCVELHFFINEKRYQFIANSNGAMYDSCDDDVSWNAQGVNISNSQSKKTWKIEISIPREQIGLKKIPLKVPAKINICRSFGTITSAEPLPSCIAPAKAGYGDTANMLELYFSENLPNIDFSGFNGITNGSLDLTFASQKAKPTSVTVDLNVLSGGSSLFKFFKTISANLNQPIRITKSPLVKPGEIDFRVTAENKLLYYNRMKYSLQNVIEMSGVITSRDRQNLLINMKQGQIRLGSKTQIAFIDKAGRIAFKQDTINPGKNDYCVKMKLSSLPIGSYTLRVSWLSPQGRVMGTRTTSYTKYPTPAPWMGNRIGITDKVPAPWAPMEKHGDTVEMWGRTYTFKNTLFPSQINSQDHELLAAPIKLIATSTNKEYMSDDHADVEFKVISPDKIVCRTSGNVGPLRVRCDITMEYDGFMWIDMKLAPLGKVELDKLVFEIPMQLPYSTLINSKKYHGAHGGKSGLLGNKKWNKDLMADFPLFWVGNENVGLEWFAETLKGWYANNTENVEVTRLKDYTSIKLNLIDHSVDLSKPWEISFGLMATPVRPAVKNYRTLRMGEDGRQNLWDSDKDDGTKQNLSLWFVGQRVFNYPEVVGADRYFSRTNNIGEKLIEAKRKRGGNVCVYHAFTEASPLSDEFKWQGFEWMAYPSTFSSRVNYDNLMSHVAIDPNSKEYRDFYLWRLEKAVKANEYTGLYFDFGHPTYSINPGWKDAHGNLKPEYPILGCRELAKRIYVMMKQYNPDATIAYHTSQGEVMAFLSFSDIMVTGEDYINSMMGNKLSYYKQLSLDEFRAAYLPKQWGPLPVFLAQFTRAFHVFDPQRKDYWRRVMIPFVHHLEGMILVHDAQYDSNWGLSPLDSERVKHKFGVNENTEFVGYWDDQKYFKKLSPKTTEVVMSAYIENGQALFILFNNTDKRQDVKIDISGMKIKNIDSNVLEDQISGDKFENMGDGIFNIEMKKRSYRLLLTK